VWYNDWGLVSEGIHHIGLRVFDIELMLNRLKEIGIPLRGKGPEKVRDGLSVAMVDPVFTQNILIEIVERAD
jgi:hypothetical protein